MKKLLLTLAGLLPLLPAQAQDFTYEYEGQTLTYTVIDATTCRTKNEIWPETGNNVSGELIIPSSVSDGENVYTVTEIGDYGFYLCDGLTSITLPGSITSIGEGAFYWCTSLTSITIPESVTSIGPNAFSSSGLISVTIPTSVTCISDGVFLDCQSLTSITIPNSVTSIGDNAFNSCLGLTSVVIPGSVTTIGRGAFERCYGLTSMSISGSVTSIGSWAFTDCKGLTSVVIPGSVTTIGRSAFERCSGLTSMIIPNSVTSIDDNTFSSCSGLTSVTIPNSVTTIGREAFSGCTSLPEIVLPPSLETMGFGVFSGDTELATVVMGHKIRDIGQDAFLSCPEQTIFITAQTPPFLWDDTFGWGVGQLYVQGAQALEKYSSADVWERFYTKEVMTEPTDLRLEDDSPLAGKTGDTFRLSAKLYPEDVTLPYVFWRSTNPAIATVDNNGLVTLHVDSDDIMLAAEGDEFSDNTCRIIAETLYADGPTAEVSIGENTSTAIEDIIDRDAPLEVYNLQGLKVSDTVDNLAAGIYIVRQDKNVRKIAVK